MQNEIYLGTNLSSARPVEVVEREKGYLVLDGRELRNPSCQPVRGLPKGRYQITRTSGRAPGDVGYYGYALPLEPTVAPLTPEDLAILGRMSAPAGELAQRVDEKDAHVMLSAIDPDRALARGLTYQRGIGIMDPSNPACWEPVEIDRCWYRDGTPKPCSRHAAEARAAADAAEAAYRENRAHMPAQDVATGAQGARAYAWRRALERPLTPCADGAKGLGWPGDDDAL